MSRKVSSVSQKTKAVQAVNGRAQILPEVASVSEAGLDEFSALVEQIAASFSQLTANAESEKVSIKLSIKEKNYTAREKPQHESTPEPELQPINVEKKAEKAVEKELKAEAHTAKKAEKEEHKAIKEEESAIPSEENHQSEEAIAEIEAQAKSAETEVVQESAASESVSATATATATATAAAETQKPVAAAEEKTAPALTEAVTNEEVVAAEAAEVTDETSAEQIPEELDEAASEESLVTEAVVARQKQAEKLVDRKNLEATAAALNSQNPAVAGNEELNLSAPKVRTGTENETPAQAEERQLSTAIENVLANKLNVNQNPAIAQMAGSQAGGKEKAPLFNETAFAATARAQEVLASLISEPHSVLTAQAIKPVIEAGAVKQLVLGEAKEQSNLLSGIQQIAQKAEAAVKNMEASAKQELLKNAKSAGRVPLAQAMEKVEAVLKEAARSRDGNTISLRLDPPNLGSVKVDVTFRDGTLHARLVAEAPAVNALLRERSHELQALLRNAGVNIEKVSVSVSSGQNFESSFNSANGSQNGSRQGQTGGTLNGGSFAAGQAVAGGASAVENVLDHWVA